MKHRGGKARSKQFGRNEDGSITIEFVVTFPLILCALAFSFEFGRMFIAHHTLVNNVRSAERYLARSDLSATRIDEAEQIILTGFPSGGVQPPWIESDDIDIDTSASTFTDANFRKGGQVIRIEATINFQFLIANFLGGDNGTIPITVAEEIVYTGE